MSLYKVALRRLYKYNIGSSIMKYDIEYKQYFVLFLTLKRSSFAGLESRLLLLFTHTLSLSYKMKNILPQNALS